MGAFENFVNAVYRGESDPISDLEAALSASLLTVEGHIIYSEALLIWGGGGSSTLSSSSGLVH